jgi:acyl-CoA hydrolase
MKIINRSFSMHPSTYITHHLVKSEDLNHHGSLYAGRCAEWFVESGFIAAAALTRPQNIVCLQIHGMHFTRPIRLGEVVCFESQVVLTGRSRIVTYIRLKSKEEYMLEGFITFVNVDPEGNPLPHDVTIEPHSDEEKALFERAQNLNR